MELKNKFKKGDFVQEISFKHDGLPRHDLGIEKFGFIKMNWIIARTYHEYEVIYSNFIADENIPNTLEYCLRPVSEDEIHNNLAYIANHQEDFLDFIIALNDTASLEAYHIVENDQVVAYRNELSASEVKITTYEELPQTEFCKNNDNEILGVPLTSL
ncbi:MAG: hypothetical protein ACRCST_13125 [Turicibacter sp.]